MTTTPLQHVRDARTLSWRPYRVARDSPAPRAPLPPLGELCRRVTERHVAVVASDGRTLLDVPLAMGVAAAALAPAWVAVGAIAALAADYTLVVWRPAVFDAPRPASPGA